MDIIVNKELKTPIYRQIALQIRTKILMNELNDGSILPSERQMAKLLSVHRNTVVKAYNELETEEFIEAKQGVGYIVTYQEPEFTGVNDKRAKGRERPRQVFWENVIKEEHLIMEDTFDELFTKSYSEDSISFGAGMADANAYTRQDIVRGIEEAVRQNQKAANFYTPYQGDIGLRKQIAALMRERGLAVDVSEIQIFSEMNQALDFVFSLMLKEGDCVITEEPISPDVHRALKLLGVRQITLPLDQEGMICQNIEALILKHKPKLIYVNSSYQDPTGSVLSLKRRKLLLDYSYKYSLPIIEEDAASMLDFDGTLIPTIKSLDKADNVIYIYSFSLTLIPGISVAFVLAPKPVIKSLSHLVSVLLVSVAWVPQKLLEYYLKEGIYKKSVNRMKLEYKEKMQLMYSAIEKANIKDFYCDIPSGGVYLWCHLPPAIDSKVLAKQVAKKGVNIIPGDVFFLSGRGPESYIRLNYSVPTKEEITEGMRILIQTIKEIL